MTATRSYHDALARLTPAERTAFVEDSNRWRVTVGGVTFPAGTDFEVSSRFGSIKSAVVTNTDGTPNHDKPIVYEAPATNILAWGRDKHGTVKVSVIRQPRPHADDPDHQGANGHAPVLFGQVPMGYLEKVLGGTFETAEAGAVREAGEETGATAVLSIERPKCPWHNPNPSFVGSWTDLVFVEVDLEKIEALKADHNEPIYSAEYLPVPELLRRIKEGKDEAGAYYRMCTSNSLWLIFFATHPELFQA